MSRIPLSPDALQDQTESLNRLDKPSIRVLIYTDDPNKIREDGNFGIREYSGRRRNWAVSLVIQDTANSNDPNNGTPGISD